MLKFKISRRDEKKAQQKLAILDGFIQAMKDKKLTELSVEEISNTIGISKVTFFNYFGSKEEVVEYFVQLWQFTLNYELNEKGIKGRDKLKYIYDSVASHPSYTSIMNALTAYFLKIDCYSPSELSEIEMVLYHEIAYKKGYRSKQLYEILKEATNELNLNDEQSNHLIVNFMSGFYGIPLVASLGFGSNVKAMFENYLNKIIPEVDRYEE